MNDTEHDPVVRTALRDLPVPEHLPGFWERLDARLDAEDRRAPDLATTAPSAATPAADRPADARIETSELPLLALLHPDPVAPRHQRVRFLAAAAVVVLVALTAGVILRGDGGTGDDEGGQFAGQPAGGDAPTPFAAPGEAPPEAGPTTTQQTAATTIPFPESSTPEEAVLTWIEALASGDRMTAEVLLGPHTEEYLTAIGEDVTMLAEGYGSWATSEPAVTSIEMVPEREVAVVVLAGTRTVDGTAEYAMHAIPVVWGVPGSWLVEPMAGDPTVEGGGLPELVSPSDHGAGMLGGLTPDGVIEAHSTAPGATYRFSLDFGPFVEDADGIWDPPGDLAGNVHPLVVLVTGDRLLAAVGGEFTVEG